MSHGAWQDAEVTRKFLEERRAAIPYGPDQLRMLTQVVEHLHPAPRRIVDLGCGDGILSRAVLEAWPDSTALLLDYSEPMLARAREAMAPYGDRVRMRAADMARELPEDTDGADLVISGFAIHHLPHRRKESLYQEIHQRLAPGGLFVHIEHVASASPELEALFDRLYIHHLAARSGRPQEQVEHEYHTRPDKADNILLSLETQLQWLRQFGFRQVDCYFKWLELAVFGGVK